MDDGTRATANIYELGVTYFPSQNWQILGGYRFEQRRTARAAIITSSRWG